MRHNLIIMRKLIFALIIGVTFSGAKAQMTMPESPAKFPMSLDEKFNKVDIPEAAVYFREFTPNSGVGPGGFIRDYYFNGFLQTEGGTHENSLSGSPENHNKEGVYYWYYPTGNINSIAYFINNMAEGRYSMFYENGALQEEGQYAGGQLNGECYSYYENGSRKSYSRYNNGNLENKSFEEYSEDGVKSMVYFENFLTAQNSYGWQIGDFDAYSGNIEAKVGVKLKNKDYNRMVFSFKKPDVLTGTPYYYSCWISSNGGDAGPYFGVTFDFTDWKNYKYFVISDKGYYAVGQYTSGTNTYLISPTYSTDINKTQSFGAYLYDNQNLIEITNQNGKTRFSVNNKLLDTSLPVFSGYGQFGLYIESGVKTVTFNSFFIKSK